MPQRFEGTFRGFKDAELFYQAWTASDPRGTLLITHGLAEHSECYHALAEKLASERWNVWAWDLPGHGKSEGKRGFVEAFDDFLKDLETFVAFVKSQRDLPAPLPHVLFGHSLGGLIVTRTLLEMPISGINAVVLSSPALGLKKKVPTWKHQAAEIAAKWLPTLTMNNEIRWRELTHDEEQIRSYDHDPLRHDRISPALFLGMLESFDRIRQQEHDFAWPLCLQVGGLDPIVDVARAQEFFANTSSSVKQLDIYADSLHEIYNDLDKRTVFDDLKKFLAKVS
jgi:alpha-beta hydrolase superfamily lysophospholipase